MRKSNILVICFFLAYISSSKAQSLFTDNLQGKIQSVSEDLADVHVLNITTKKATITNAYGYFSIPVKLNDTLLFSAVQFKKKEVIVTRSVLKSPILYVSLEEALNELDEVVVTPYNLSGNIEGDIESLKTGPVVTAATLGLPNAYVKPLTQAERHLIEATTGGGLVPLNPILNGISGRTKMLKRRLARDKKYARTTRVREFYADSLYLTELKIPIPKIADFMYFCEVDSGFDTVVDTRDKLKIWGFLQKKSIVYRANNKLE
ncbi:MAG: carboxypeptidase-like regulatory domain-containing protein [Saonia sp.]